MRTSAAVLVVAAAAALGTVTGAVVLPDHGDVVTARPRPGSAGDAAPASPAGSSPAPSGPASGSGSSSPAAPSGPGGGPIRTANMLQTDDLQAVGLEVSPARILGQLDVESCTDDGYERQTLAAMVDGGAPVQRAWQAERVGVDEAAVAARDAAQAAAVVRRIVRTFETCQRRPPEYWVNTRTHSERLGPGTTLSWVGVVDGTFNTTGRAPAEAGISGGTAVVRRGAHVAVIRIGWCNSAGDSPACLEGDNDPGEQLAALSRTAALRLG